MKDDLDLLEEELLQDPATREAYERRRPAYELALKFVAMREALGLTQRQLAARAGMTQPEIARIEAAEIQPTWATVSRILAAVDAVMEIRVRDASGKLVRLTLDHSSVRAPQRATRAV